MRFVSLAMVRERNLIFFLFLLSSFFFPLLPSPPSPPFFSLTLCSLTPMLTALICLSVSLHHPPSCRALLPLDDTAPWFISAHARGGPTGIWKELLPAPLPQALTFPWVSGLLPGLSTVLSKRLWDCLLSLSPVGRLLAHSGRSSV